LAVVARRFGLFELAVQYLELLGPAFISISKDATF
jgi:hypothetical protein